MAGSPKKRARKLGLDIPNAGDKAPKYPRARARARELGPLLTDDELEGLAKRTLGWVMQHGADDKDAVAAARAMLEARRRAGAPSDPLERMTADELDAAAREAEAVLGRQVQ